MASQTITIHRRDKNTNMPKELLEESKRKIGSAYAKAGGPIKGLSPEEEKKVLPRLLGISFNDPNYYAKSKRFFEELSVEVPTSGASLEVGKDDTGIPYNVLDYIKYKFILAHPHVANTEKELTNNAKFEYYIHDSKLALKRAHSAVNSNKKAYAEFIKISADEDKMNIVLLALGQNPDQMDSQSKEIWLEDYTKTEPENFYIVASNKNLEWEAFLNECLTYGVLRQVGNALLYMDDKLGDDREETILHLKSKKNSSTLTVLKAKLDSFK